MITELPGLDELPRQNASQVKNKWGEVVRLVQELGSVAITNHSAVEMVLLRAATYRQLVQEVLALNAREQSVLNELASRFNSRLSALQQADAGQRVRAVFAAKGKLTRRPRAGTSF
jgi:PHD/YefM family antitoxin component YafN of YafNO toxin-antitoxin module